MGIKKAGILSFRNINFRYTWLLMICVVTAVVMWRVQVVDAQPNETTCKSLDLVVVIDQSTSMDNNDPRRARFDVADLIIDKLGEHAIWLCPDEPVAHRLAILGFGDFSEYLEEDNDYREDVAVYLEPQEIPPPGSDLAAWDGYREGLKRTLDNFDTDNLGGTDHEAAMLNARDILQEWKQQPLGESQRRQGIILITDGEGCTASGGCQIDEPYVFSRQGYIDRLLQLTNPNGQDLPWRGSDNPDSVHISMIALTDLNSSFNYRTDPVFSDGWARITQDRGIVYLADQENLDLASGVADVLDPLVGSGLNQWDCQVPIWINPYVDNLAILHIYTQGAVAGSEPEDVRVAIGIQTVGQRTIIIQGGTPDSDDVSVDEYTRDGLIERYVFRRPLPGRYEILAENADVCDDLDVRTGTNPVTIEVVTPANNAIYPEVQATPFYNPDVADKFRVLVRSQGDIPLEEYDDYPLLVEALIEGPNGHEQRVELRRVEDGVYESDSFIQTPGAGGYTWELNGQVASPNPETEGLVDVFASSGRFQAGDVDGFNFIIQEPIADAVLDLNQVQGVQQLPLPIPVTVILTDEAGDTLSSNVLRNPEEIFRATLYDANNQRLEETTLTPLPGTPNQFVGQFANGNEGVLNIPGPYTIEVEADWNADNYDTTQFVPLSELSSVTFEQTEVIPLDVIIHPPQGASLHEGGLGCVRGTIVPYDFSVEILNAKTGEAVSLGDVLADEETSYSAAVVSPNGASEVVTLTPHRTSQSERLQASGAGLQTEEAGEYEIRLPLSNYALQAGYAWAEAERTATFERGDSLQTRPFVCRLVAGTAAVVLFGLILWAGYMLTGGPRGSLQVVGSRQRTIGGPWTLRATPRHNRIKDPWLAENGIKRLKVSRSSPTLPDVSRAVSVEVEYEDPGRPTFAQTLNDDAPEPFDVGEILYKSG